MACRPGPKVPAGAEHGFRVSIRPPAGVGSVDGYQACVVGSAVYAGRWRKRARQLITDNARALRSRPVWLFSSGPIGDPTSGTGKRSEPGPPRSPKRCGVSGSRSAS